MLLMFLTNKFIKVHKYLMLHNTEFEHPNREIVYLPTRNSILFTDND